MTNNLRDQYRQYQRAVSAYERSVRLQSHPYFEDPSLSPNFLERTLLELEKKAYAARDERVTKFFDKKWKTTLTECKYMNTLISESLERIYDRRASIDGEEEYKKNQKRVYKVSHCGDRLGFYVHEGQKQLHVEGYFCDHRLCPVCNWFISRSMYGKLWNYCMNDAETEKKSWVMIGLTVPNVPGDQLRDTVLKMNKAVGKIFRTGDGSLRFDQCFVGMLSKVEITYNCDPNSPSFRTFHPHVHIICECRSDYKPGTKHFMHTSELAEKWRKYMGDECILVPFMKQIRPRSGKGIESAVAEVSKYPFKYDDRLFIDEDPKTLELRDEFVEVIDGLRGVRMQSASGTIRKMLHFVSKDDEHDTRELPYTPGVIFMRMDWHHGFDNYHTMLFTIDENGMARKAFRDDVERIDLYGRGPRGSPKS